ncbi:MAG: WG repeat-containing protein [Ruminococcus sp.]|nr:WG repeat-containing protein [Ruminococcus sp.]
MNKIIPVLILGVFLLMLVLSWKSVLEYNGHIHADHDRHIKLAEEYEEKGIYIDAVKEYEAANDIVPDHDLSMHIAQLYKELNEPASYIKSCEQAIKIDPSQPEPYLAIAEQYLDKLEFDKAYDILKDFQDAGGSDEEVEKTLYALLGRYGTESLRYDDFTSWIYAPGSDTGYARVSVEGKFGLLNTNNKLVYQCEYEDIGPLMNDLIPVCSNGEYYYMDKDLHRKRVPDHKADYLGPFSSELAPALIDGKYGYLDKDMGEKHFEYEYAGCFYNGIAPVKQNGKWTVINESFKNVTDLEFDEILIDDCGACSVYGVFWAKKNGKYALYDLSGKKLSDDYDEVRLFASEEPAAVKSGSGWGFVSKAGELVIQPSYDDAGSFSLGYAPVRIDGKWGCIDQEENVLIKPEMDEMGSFYKNGYALVKMDGIKQFIVLELFD